MQTWIGFGNRIGTVRGSGSDGLKADGRVSNPARTDRSLRSQTHRYDSPIVSCRQLEGDFGIESCSRDSTGHLLCDSLLSSMPKDITSAEVEINDTSNGTGVYIGASQQHHIQLGGFSALSAS